MRKNKGGYEGPHRRERNKVYAFLEYKEHISNVVDIEEGDN